MKYLLNLDDCLEVGSEQVGGKALALAEMNRHGLTVPDTLCIPCEVNDAYVSQTRLKDRIFLELNRKPLDQMRWEEMWDIGLRIRNLFLTTPMPETMGRELIEGIRSQLGRAPMALRSSAPGEDSGSTSFAGLHASFLNLSSSEEILKHIRLVWASLYSDAALLYRKELELDLNDARMAVVVQPLIASDRSGIFFGRNPSNREEAVLEAVYGLNQGLVDGDIEPDRWILHGNSGRIISHGEPVRDRCAVGGPSGVEFRKLTREEAASPPVSSREIQQIREWGSRLEDLFGGPQDVEWTLAGDELILLQSRPITTTGSNGDAGDKRAWYLTLHRSCDNLKTLYHRIQDHLIPRMIQGAREMGQVDLASLSVDELCREIEGRQATYDHWVKVYWDEFIPFAHGIRLFGQVYNDAVAPEDPYEFMALLENTGLKSMDRNRRLEELADLIRRDAELKAKLAADELPGADHEFTRGLDEFISDYGDLACATGSGSECVQGAFALTRLLLEFAGRRASSARHKPHSMAALKENYFNQFSADQREFARDILELGRESYRLRDDDNIHLGRIEARLWEAVQEGQKRLADSALTPAEIQQLNELPALSLTRETKPVKAYGDGDALDQENWVNSRQIVGHPAGPGIATGPARLIREPGDLLSFKQGEILVCRGVDPNMTFVVPLAAAVIEERGGMLIHGAIIAREYGLPCITGATQAMERLTNGRRITVDGYLGIITSQTREL